MKYFLIFLIFAVGEITIGEALKCLKCTATGKEDCSGSSVVCKNKNDFCVEAIEVNEVNKNKIITIRRGCSNMQSMCTEGLMMHNKNFTMMINNRCCYADNCNNGKIEIPVLNTTKNHVECMSCYVEGNDKCKVFEPMHCTGNATKCLEYRGYATRSGEMTEKYAMVACATKEACYSILKALVGTKTGKKKTLLCNKRYLIRNDRDY